MKIALFVGGMWRGGVTTFVLDFAQFLQKTGHTVRIVAPEQGEWWPRLAEASLTGVWLPPQAWESNLAYAKRLASYLVQEAFDTFLINNGIGGRPAQLCLPYLPPHIAAIPILHSSLPRVFQTTRINQHAWQVVIADSPKVEQIAKRYWPDKPIQMIPYGISLPDEKQLASRVEWKLPLHLLFVGTLIHKLKGVFLLPEIVAACRAQDTPVRMTIIGTGSDEQRLRQLIAAHKVDDQIVLLGAQPHNAVLQAMQQHHILIAPSYVEGLPLVSLEAQAAGCVPIASRLEGIMDYSIEEGVSGYLATIDDAQDFADRIAMLDDKSRWQAASRAGMARAQRLFSVPTMGQQYLSLLEQVAAGAYPLEHTRKAPGPWTLFNPQAGLTFKDYLPGRLRRLGGRYWHRVRRLSTQTRK